MDIHYGFGDFKYKIRKWDQNKIFQIIQYFPQLWYFGHLPLDSIPRRVRSSFLLDTISIENDKLQELVNTFSKILFKGG